MSNRSTLLLSFCSILLLLILSIFYHLSPHISAIENWPAIAVYFRRIFIDFLILIIVGSWLINAGRIGRILLYIILVLFCLGYTIQISAYFLTQQFLTVLATDNINHFLLIVSWRRLAIALPALLVILIIPFWLVRRKKAQDTLRRLIILTGLCLLIGYAFTRPEQFFPKRIISISEQLAAQPASFIHKQSPLSSLYKTLIKGNADNQKKLTSEDIVRAKEYGIQIDLAKVFPLIKPNFYETPLPYPKNNSLDQKPNVILIFVEGLSAATVDTYHQFFPELTPNIVEFPKHAMQVNNYYNHSFATYRGLHGQLCSIYPYFGGPGGWHSNYANMKDIEYLCLHNVLQQYGYNTIFLDAHRKDAAFIDEMMIRLGFDEVLTSEDMSPRYLNNAEPLRRDSLSDQQFYSSMIGRLKELEVNTEGQHPFFLSMYNLETHAWQYGKEDSKKYPLHNYILGTIYNLDNAFGRFWKYFQNSPLKDNTIVILTTDHTHYHDRDFIRLMKRNPNYQPFFTGEIPLFIYDPTTQLPQTLDAQYTSSLALAPTVLHLLNIPNQNNPFLGRSLFDLKDQPIHRSMSSDGTQLYLIDDQGIRAKDTNENIDEFEAYFIKTLYDLERSNRIWNNDR